MLIAKVANNKTSASSGCGHSFSCHLGTSISMRTRVLEVCILYRRTCNTRYA